MSKSQLPFSSMGLLRKLYGICSPVKINGFPGLYSPVKTPNYTQ